MENFAKWKECPQCHDLAPIVFESIDSGIPRLSPSHTYMYYCRKCKDFFWQGKITLIPLPDEEVER